MKAKHTERLYEMALAGIALLRSSYLTEDNKKLIQSLKIQKGTENLLNFIARLKGTELDA